MERHSPTTSPGLRPHPLCVPPGSRCLLLIPAFNEGASVRRLVLRLRRALPTCDILVIDDGSTDDTVRQVPEGTAVVTLPFNLGIGGAMQAGYRYAALHGYDIAVQVDGDGQHRPREVGRLIDELSKSGSDFVVGSRYLGKVHYRQTASRALGAWFLRGVIRTFTGLPITDCTSGFRAANRRVIRAFAHWYPEDYPEPEVILLLHRSGYRISELGVQMRHRKTGQSSIRLFDGLYYVIKVTVCLVLDLVRQPWPRGKLVDAGLATAQSGPVVLPNATAAAGVSESAAALPAGTEPRAVPVHP
ncbi:glycosyltransferase family 2 protein [Humisphaera borealis]|uniref:Glycosyltransferase family 2 protein n=2 Tax=Humisphaera borealis TaxID=2807512 RepID=A0A7M2X506_9BACT|nr:glycosyltransferase family 2 protein [Humisphaera borealis]